MEVVGLLRRNQNCRRPYPKIEDLHVPPKEFFVGAMKEAKAKALRGRREFFAHVCGTERADECVANLEVEMGIDQA
jgi:hypothetical protein